LTALADVDVLYKAILFDLSDELIRERDELTRIGILGATRFVLLSKVEKLPPNVSVAIKQRLITRLPDYTIMEPSEDEISLAADLEMAAILAKVSLDVGESQLCSILIRRGCALLMTGDKRAICAMEILLASRSDLSGLEGKVMCLEQCVECALDRHQFETLRDAICAAPMADTSLRICFSCSSAAKNEATVRQCLSSYIGDLRHRAQHILHL
jgi:hypothetical protein